LEGKKKKLLPSCIHEGTTVEKEAAAERFEGMKETELEK